MARARRGSKKTRPLSSHSFSSLELPELGVLIGEDLYNRVMQWDDCGAADALLAAEERRLAKESRNPFWVPKLKSDLYVDPVEWDPEKPGDACGMPPSAVTLAEELALENACGAEVGTGYDGLSRVLQNVDFERVDSVSCVCAEDADPLGRAFAMLDGPVLTEAVLEESSNGVLLMVGGQPVQPSGWGESFERDRSISCACTDGDALGRGCSAQDGPVLTEAILEKSSKGVLLMVGGQPVQPSGWGEDFEGRESVSFASTEGDALGKVFPVQDSPILMEAVLEESSNGVLLMVGGQQVEPSGWGEPEVETQMWQNVDEPIFVEAVLEDFEDGQRLLVGGWPVKPSWDQLETDWDHLGWHHTCRYYGCSRGELCSGKSMPQSMGSSQVACLKPPWHNSLHQNCSMIAW